MMSSPKSKTGRNLKPIHEQLESKNMKLYVTCEICGRKYKHLTSHIINKHNIGSREYKKLYPDTEYFMSDDVRVIISLDKDRFMHTQKRMITDYEIQFIMDNFPKLTVKTIAENLGLSESTVSYSVEKYCKIRKRKIRQYTEEEIEYIINNYGITNTCEMVRFLNRPYSSIKRIARLHGCLRDNFFANNEYATFYPDGAPEPLCNERKYWIEEEFEYCKENRYTRTAKELGEFLGRSKESVTLKLSRMKIIKQNVWSKDEIAYLKNNYKVMPYRVIAEKLNRTTVSVKHKAKTLGIKKMV